jgi:elongation factor P
MAINTSDFKNGMAIDLGSDGLFQISEFQHVKPGKGGAFVRTTLRNMRTGAVVDRTFRAGEKMERAFIEKRDQQYLYRDVDGYVVMDAETYEQLTVPEETMGDAGNYLREGDTITIQFYGSEIVGSDMPASVELTISETEPGVQGDRVSGARKPATLETGLVIQVPLFVEQGDVVKVDTRTGDYITRA